MSQQQPDLPPGRPSADDAWSQPFVATFDETDHCAGCGYVLNGLPRSHRCPECGMRYELDSYSWRSPPQVPRVFGSLLFYIYIGFIPFMIYEMRLYVPSRDLLEAVFPIFIAAIVGGILLFNWRRRRSLKRGHYVRLSTEGIEIQTFTSRTAPWPMVNRIDEYGGGVHVYIAGEVRPVTINTIFTSMDEVVEFLVIAEKFKLNSKSEPRQASMVDDHFGKFIA